MVASNHAGAVGLRNRCECSQAALQQQGSAGIKVWAPPKHPRCLATAAGQRLSASGAGLSLAGGAAGVLGLEMALATL